MAEPGHGDRADLATVFSLAGRSALVVGGRAIPHAIADLIRQAGAMVVHATEREFTDEGVSALFKPLDTLDIVVNGAVRIGSWPLGTLTLVEWDPVYDVNVRGAFLLMPAAVAVMKAQGRGGRIINISTIGSLHPVLDGNFAYGSSRAGTNALTRQFAMDFAADRILANAILVEAVPSDATPTDMPPRTGPSTDRARTPRGLGTTRRYRPCSADARRPCWRLYHRADDHRRWRVPSRMTDAAPSLFRGLFPLGFVAHDPDAATATLSARLGVARFRRKEMVWASAPIHGQMA